MRFRNLLAALAMLALAAPSVLAQTEDDVVINEFVVNPATGREYVELLVVTPGANLQGWTLSDVSTRAGATGATEGDFTLPASAAYLASVPQGTYIVLEFTTPIANSSTLTEDLDPTDRSLVIKTTTTGVVLGGTIDNATNDNLHLYAGTRAAGTLIDQVLAGTNTSYITGATWGDNDGTTTTDNVNGGTAIPSNSATRFVPVDQTGEAGFRANDTGSVFTVDATSYGTPADTNTGVDDSQIPVELTSFTARANGSVVDLAWETASETNNAGFEVQHRAPGQTAFAARGFVEGHGTTTETQRYAFEVAALTAGTHAFRLRQVDFDGTVSFSPVVEASVGVPGTHALTQAYPNPFNPQASFSLSVAAAQDVSVELYNALGQRVATLFEGAMEAGEARAITIDGAALPSGLYLYRATGATFSATGRVTLVK